MGYGIFRSDEKGHRVGKWLFCWNSRHTGYLGQNETGCRILQNSRVLLRTIWPAGIKRRTPNALFVCG